jgi:heme oxygenase
MSQMMKEGCADLHDKAEHAKVPSRMVSGEMTIDEYCLMLQQDAIWNKALDLAILKRRGENAYLMALVDDIQLQGPYFDQDLAHFGLTDECEPTPGVSAMCKTIEEAADKNSLTLLGLHYVREGANNGNHYVAKKLRASWGIEGDDGLRSMDPYGNNQRALWEKFKTTLDAQEFTAEEKEHMVHSGRTMFERVMAIHEDLAAATA